jgi:hypothetical protein
MIRNAKCKMQNAKFRNILLDAKWMIMVKEKAFPNHRKLPLYVENG